MPELKQSKFTPQLVRQELQLPDAFPPLPSAIRERFGTAAEDFDQSARQWWTRTKRALSESHYELARPQNEIKEDTRNIRKEFVTADATLAASFEEAITVVVNDLGALVTRTETLEASVNEPGTPGGLLARVMTEESASATRDGHLSAKWGVTTVTQTGTGRKVITGINLSSTTDSGTDISEVNIQADRLRMITSTMLGAGAAPIALLDVSTDGFVFGTDIVSDNYDHLVAGWLLTRDGNFECNNAIVRGTIYSTAGSIGGFSLSFDGLTATTGTDTVTLKSAGGGYLQFEGAGDTNAYYAIEGLTLMNAGGDFAAELRRDPATDTYGILKLFNGAGAANVTLDGSSGAVACGAITAGGNISAGGYNMTCRTLVGQTGDHLYFGTGGVSRWSISDSSGDLVARASYAIKKLTSDGWTPKLVDGAASIEFQASGGQIFGRINGGAAILLG